MSNRPAKLQSAAKLAEYYKPAAAQRKSAKTTAATEDDPQPAAPGARLIDFSGVPSANTTQAPPKSPLNSS